MLAENHLEVKILHELFGRLFDHGDFLLNHLALALELLGIRSRSSGRRRSKYQAQVLHRERESEYESMCTRVS